MKHRSPHPNRRQFLRSAAVSFLAAMPAGSRAAVQGSRPLAVSQPLHLVNGAIHTMNAQGSIANSASIVNGRFEAVGNAVTAADGARTIDLGGRTVVPGLIEPHIHSVSLASRPGYHVILENTRSMAGVQRALAARRAAGVPDGQWITSMGGWHPIQWAEQRRPTRAELDDAVSDRPVLLYERFTGPAVTNTLGKEYFDRMDAGDPVHPNVVPVNVGDDGSIAAAGFGGGGPSATALYYLRRMQTFDDRRRSTIDAMDYSASVGLTAQLDQVLFPTPGPLDPSQILSNLDHYRMYDPWLELHREGQTTIRLQMNFLHNQGDPALPELRERLRTQFQFFGDDMLMTGAIGEWAAPIGAGDAGVEAQRLVAEAGWRNENSVQSLAALEQVVEAYERVHEEFGIGGLRWMVHHVPEVNQDLLDRLHAMGCGVELGAYRWVTSSDPDQIVGPPFRTVYDHPIQTGIHGDGVHIAPLNPWPHIQYAVTGMNSLGDRVNGDQVLTRQEALELFTRQNAWFLRMEEKIGSIEEGKLADLVVLDRDYFSIPEDQIRDIRAVLTIVDGKVVHGDGAI
jgi:predicted amidohydrolase YtcJ